MNVLLSIKPEYVDEILKGKKKFEFRKSIFKRRDITEVFIYSSSPVKKIVASFEIAGIIEDSPKNIWDQCQEYGGIAKDDFFDYFKNSKISYAIKICNLREFSEPIDPYLLKKDFRPPQSYYYLPLDYFRDYEPVLMEYGNEYRTDMDSKLDTQNKMLNKNISKLEEKYGWKTVRLGDFAIYKKGKKPKKQQSEASDVFKYPYIDIRAFDKGEIKYYTDGENCVICEEDDLLMVWDGSRSGYVGKAIKGALGSTLMSLKFHATENKFAYYFLKSKYLEINTKPKGTGTPHVDPAILWNYQFPLPPLPEQRSIVSKIEQLFSELDNGIANLKKAQEQLKVYRQAVLKKAFEGNWDNTTVGELFNFKGGGTPSKKNPDYWNGELPWCSVKDVKGDYLFTTMDKITDNGLQNSASNIAKIDEVILVTRISPGKSTIAKIETAINQDLKIIKPKYQSIPSFIHYLFKSIENECLNLSSGTTVLGINLTNLKSIQIPKISFQEQQAIVTEIETRLSVCDKVEQDIEENLEKAEALRQSILKKAFEGKLLNQQELEEVHNAPDWEPAEVLLEKVQAEKAGAK